MLAEDWKVWVWTLRMVMWCVVELERRLHLDFILMCRWMDGLSVVRLIMMHWM